VLYINENLRDRHRDLLNPKFVQISKYSTFQELENKLIRIFKNLSKENESEEFEFRIYKFDRDTKEIFDMIIAYVNRNKSFKLIVKELKKSECNSRTIFDMKIGSKDILIIEALPKNSIVKPFIKVTSENLICSICNIKIESSVINCESCSQVLKV
jgi:hypothetical protein